MNANDDSEDKSMVDNICTEVLVIINALKHPDCTQQMEEKKAHIYERISHKIIVDQSLHASKGRKIRLSPAYLPAACIALVLFLSAVAAAYRIGYSAEKEVLPVQTQVELSVPYGVISQLKLPDGSLVTLNGGSQLSYPAIFDKDRQVYLCGEGFFDVVKDEAHPFVVHTKNISVKVLGTRFSFKAYEEDKQTILTLEEGRISATPTYKNIKESILLESNQQLILDHQTGELRRKSVSAPNYTSWKDRHLYFADLSLGEIATILERRFDVKITFTSESIRSERYHAQFEHGENVDQILDLLSRKRAWRYTKKNTQISITKNK
jgi:ferric-dicitrate binding protein FerR (iron transport regulator)